MTCFSFLFWFGWLICWHVLAWKIELTEMLRCCRFNKSSRRNCKKIYIIPKEKLLPASLPPVVHAYHFFDSWWSQTPISLATLSSVLTSHYVQFIFFLGCLSKKLVWEIFLQKGQKKWFSFVLLEMCVSPSTACLRVWRFYFHLIRITFSCLLYCRFLFLAKSLFSVWFPCGGLWASTLS